MMRGESGAPRVRVTGPRGQVLESPAGSELVASTDTKIRIMRSDQGKFVAVGLADVPPGSYTIEPMAGSPAIASVQESSALPNARVRARVTGNGKRRTLSYTVGRRPNQSVSFWEVDAGGASTPDRATIAAGGGKLRFSPAPGRGRGGSRRASSLTAFRPSRSLSRASSPLPRNSASRAGCACAARGRAACA